MSGAEHAADEAAGEVIFSSDGLEPPILTSPPPLPPPSNQNDDDKAVLETTGISADQAFEVFAGKMYATQPSSSATTTSRSLETPWQRLARLEREVQELQADLTAGDDNAGAAVTQAVRALQERLSHTTITSSAVQERLSQQLADSAVSLTGGGSPTKTVAAAAQAAPEIDWDGRLRQLEKLIGTGGLSDSHSLLERLATMEGSIAKMTDKDLEASWKKAKVIRQDLEAASKARNKLLASRDANAESSKSIADLHDQMTQLQGMSRLLPVLVTRLQALATQHAQATTWSQRLAATEQQAVQLQTATTKLDASLVQLEGSLQTSVQQMEDNMKALDAKLAK
jgi:myosin heavy subunit